MAPRPNWKGFLKLSLVSCSVALYPATSTAQRIRFNIINKKTGNRIRNEVVDTETGEPVDADDRVKGYEYEKGQYILLDDEELDNVALESTHTIDIEEFVPMAEVDRIYLDESFYIVPQDEVAEEAFAVIREAMRKEDLAGLARVVVYRRERLLLLRPRGKGMLATALRYKNEVRDEKTYFDDIPDIKVPADMLKLASHILDTKRGHFDPEQVRGPLRECVDRTDQGQARRQRAAACTGGAAKQRHQSDGCAAPQRASRPAQTRPGARQRTAIMRARSRPRGVRCGRQVSVGNTMAGLKTYHAKRRFGVTSEPKGKVERRTGNAFVIQKHDARRLHYDLRLELDGVMKSWAVTRGPSLVPGDKRLAVQVEDHPIDYNTFEGTIPAGEYGGGTVMVWDRGTWQSEADPHRGLENGHLSFTLDGEKLHGGWHLVRMRRRPGEKKDNWLLIKQDDAAARQPGDKDILEQKTRSVKTGRSMDEIAKGAAKTPSLARAKRTIAQTAARAPKRNATRKRAGDELPAFVEPSLATLSDKAPATGNWIHEIKFDGYRLQARLDHGKVKLLTRRGLDWTKKFPSIAAPLAKLPATTALIDGEVVVEGEDGVSSFSLLQQALKSGRYRPHGLLCVRSAASRRRRHPAFAVAHAQGGPRQAPGTRADDDRCAERVDRRAGARTAQACAQARAGRHRLQARRRRLSFRPRA